MAKTIITQNGTIVNYSHLLAVYVDVNLDDEEQILGYDLIGVTGTNQDSQALILGSYPDEAAVVQAKNELIDEVLEITSYTSCIWTGWATS